MKTSKLFSAIMDNPVIAAIKTESDLNMALTTDVTIIFVLHSDIFSIEGISKSIHDAGKIGFVHINLIKGLADDEVGLSFVKQNTDFDGIISTKTSTIRMAKNLGFYTIHRLFMIDSMALDNLSSQIHFRETDIVEILPNVNGKIIQRIHEQIKKPLIVSGLIVDKEDVMHALGHGAIAISSTNHNVWQM